MVEFIFVLSCITFVCTVSWVSYELTDTKKNNPRLYALVGFVLSFVPPFALFYIAYLAFKESAVPVNKRDNC